MADFASLLNPTKEPPPRLMKAIDLCSWALPALGALFACMGGWFVLHIADQFAASFSIAGDVIGALGVLATN